jgi:hypothetical protein
MSHLREFFQAVDLAAFAEGLIAFIDSTDPCFVALVLGVLTLLGSRMAAPYPALKSWGLRLAAAAFLLYGGYAYFSHGSLTTEHLPRVGLRAAIAAGMVLAPLWTVLPILAFVYGRVRLALAAFLAYTAYAYISLGSFDPDAFPEIALRALLATGLALVVAWILQPVLNYASAILPVRPRRRCADGALVSEHHREERSPLRELERPARRDLEAEEHFAASRRERNRLEMEAQAEAQRRRHRARLRAELVYVLHAAEIGDRFTPAMFKEFLARYLGDQHAPEDVEEYGRQLEAILHQHVGKGEPIQPFGSISDLTRWFLGEQRLIHTLDLAEETKKTQLLGLNQRYSRMAQQLLEDVPA